MGSRKKILLLILISCLYIISVLHIISNMYMRKHLNFANFHLSYPRSWKLITEDKTDEFDFCVLENSRGIKINCYVTKNGPGSQYYGGNYILENVHITKVSNIQNISKLPKFIDIPKFQTPIIAKIKVYSYNDGKVTDKKVEIDGPTYYAILPEDYLRIILFVEEDIGLCVFGNIQTGFL